MDKSILSRKIILVCFGLISVFQAVNAQQEAMYSQYMFNLMNINPAYAGNRSVDNITLLYRNQWVGIDGAPETATLSWDRRHKETNVGYGLQFYNDRLGIETSTGLQAFYSYRIPFAKSSLSFGLSGGVLYYRAALSEATTITAGDPLFHEDITGWLPTAGFGALYESEKWYIGFSMPAMLRTQINEDEEPAFLGIIQASNHYFLTGGYIFDLTEAVKLKPSALLKAVKGAPLQLDLNLNAWFGNDFGIGASYRTGDAVVGMFELKILPQLRLGYSYDFNISKLMTYSKGTHEIMLRYEFGTAKQGKILSPRYY